MVDSFLKSAKVTQMALIIAHDNNLKLSIGYYTYRNNVKWRVVEDSLAIA